MDEEEKEKLELEFIFHENFEEKYPRPKRRLASTKEVWSYELEAWAKSWLEHAAVRFVFACKNCGEDSQGHAFHEMRQAMNELSRVAAGEFGGPRKYMFSEKDRDNLRSRTLEVFDTMFEARVEFGKKDDPAP
jgi:hypothetical protein